MTLTGVAATPAAPSKVRASRASSVSRVVETVADPPVTSSRFRFWRAMSEVEQT